MNAEIRTEPIPEAESYRHRTDGGRDGSECYVCGRKTSEQYFITVGGGGGQAIHPEDAEDAVDDAGFMGRHAIGSSCAKKLPDGFITERTEPEADRVETFRVEDVNTYGFRNYRGDNGRDVEFEVIEKGYGTKIRSARPVVLGTTKTGSKQYPVRLTGYLRDGEPDVSLESHRFDLWFDEWNEEELQEQEG